MVKLRLTRRGKKKQPFYRIVAMDVTAARQGQTLGLVGTYDPLHAEMKIDEEVALLWLNRGAQMSETVESLFRSQGILARWRGLEGKVREDALQKDKPARRRKLATQTEVPEEEAADVSETVQETADVPETVQETADAPETVQEPADAPETVQEPAPEEASVDAEEIQPEAEASESPESKEQA